MNTTEYAPPNQRKGAWPATQVVTRAVNVLPASLAPRVVIRDLPEGATW